VNEAKEELRKMCVKIKNETLGFIGTDKRRNNKTAGERFIWECFDGTGEATVKSVNDKKKIYAPMSGHNKLHTNRRSRPTASHAFLSSE
jgi:hypothetical protein